MKGTATITVTVRLFAGIRERAGTDRLILRLPPASTVNDVIAHISASNQGSWTPAPSLMLALNNEYVDRAAVLRDGDELALIPPVSGGAQARPGFRPVVLITEGRLDAAALGEQVREDSDGAVVTFTGVTRDHNDGRRVKWLEYEAYRPMAEQKIVEIIHELQEKWEIGRVAVAHRVGRVEIGETSLVVAVSAVHRRPAFQAALYFIDRLKEVVPIWKKEYFEGGEEWIGEGAPADRA